MSTTVALTTNVAVGDPNHQTLHNQERQGVDDALGLVPAITVTPSSQLLWDGTNGGTADAVGRQTVNSSQWTCDLGGGETPIGSGNRWGNWEGQIYTAAQKNVGVKGGKLYIRAQRENVSSPVSGETTADYSSGRIHTQGKVTIPVNSYVEAKITFPTVPGTWGAFWAMGVNYVRNSDNTSNWPYCGEVDTVETFGHQSHKAGFACHYTAAGTANTTSAYTAHQYTGWDNSTALYEDPYDVNIGRPTYYGIWTNGTEIRRYVNHKQTFSLTQATVTAAGGQWPFNQGLFLLLNLAVAGQSIGVGSGDSQGIYTGFTYVDAGMGATMIVEPISIWNSITDPSTLGLS